MSAQTLKKVVDGSSALFILFAAAALALIGMWPVDDSVAFRMTESEWRAEAFRRLGFLAFLALGGSAFMLLLHLALYRLASVGTRKRAGRWAAISILALSSVAVAVAVRFWIVRPWF